MTTKVALGFCYRTMSPTEFIVRVIQCWEEYPAVREGGLIYVPYRHWLYEARNQMVEEFLATDAESLFMVDTDMVFTPQDVAALVDLDVPVAAGAYMFDLGRLDAAVITPEGPMTLLSDPLPDEPAEVDFAGTGFMVVKREVFEALGGTWFDHMTIDAGGTEDWWLWEDWSFCKRVKDAGFPIWLDPTVRLGHLKVITLTPSDSPLSPGGDV